MTRTAVGLVEATWDSVQLGGRLQCVDLLDQAAALDAEVAALRACASITMAEKEATDALRARVAELEAQNGALKNDAAEMTEQAATMFARAATLECERDELLKPRSPNALELAMEYGIAHAVCVMHTDSSPFFIEGFARRSRAIAALVAYDKRK